MSWWHDFRATALGVKRETPSTGPYGLKEAPVPFFGSSTAGRPVTTDWNADTAITQGLKASTWVYAANRFIASKLSPIPWVVERLVNADNDEWEEVPDHPAKTLIDNPNTLMSGQDLRERWLYNLGLAGNFLGVFTIVRKAPVEIWPLMPQHTKPIPLANGEVENYEYNVPGVQKKNIPAGEIVHGMYIDPSNFYWGMSPLQAMGVVVDTDVNAVRWNNSSLANRAKKDYAFFPNEPLSKAQWTEAREQLRSQHEGHSNAGGWFLGGMPGKLEELGMSPHEMDYINSRVQHREEILAGYGLAEILLTGKGILRNYEVAVRQFWEDVAVPALDDMMEEFNRSIMPWFDPNSQPKARLAGAKPQLRYRYDVTHIAALQENLTEKIDQAIKLQQLGVPLNTIITYLDLGLDALPGEDGPPEDEEPEDEVPAPGDEPGATARRSSRYRTKQVDWDFEWKRLDTQRLRWEEQVDRLIADQFDRESPRVVRAFESGGKAALESAIERGHDEWLELLSVIYREVIAFFGEQEAQRLEGEVIRRAMRKEIVFNPFAQFITTFIADLAANKVTQISESSKKSLAGVIGSGLAANATTPDIARSIRDQYSDWAAPSDSTVGIKRSFLIARTEVGTAQNWAQMEGARQARNELGVTIEKRWVSSRDNRVRDSHSLVDGEQRPLEEPFSNSLMFPGDPLGPAAETIQCRCVASNVVTRRR